MQGSERIRKKEIKTALSEIIKSLAVDSKVWTINVCTTANRLEFVRSIQMLYLANNTSFACFLDSLNEIHRNKNIKFPKNPILYFEKKSQ